MSGSRKSASSGMNVCNGSRPCSKTRQLTLHSNDEKDLASSMNEVQKGHHLRRNSDTRLGTVQKPFGESPLPEASTEMMNLFLKHLSQTYSKYFIVMQVDGAGWHCSQELVIPANIRLIQQPPYSSMLPFSMRIGIRAESRAPEWVSPGLWRGRIEQFRNDRQEQLGAGHDPMRGWGPANMRGGRQHREPCCRQTSQVAVRLAAAEQTKELHRVRNAQAVCIPDYDQGGCLEHRNALCPIVVLAQQLPHLGNEGRPGFRSGRGLEIGFVYWGPSKPFDAY